MPDDALPEPPAATRSRSTGAGAFELLLGAVEDGTLPPGTRLREQELAARFRISRTPVREALKRLETLGLVAHEANRGAVVASLDHGQMVELYQMREVLEGTAAALAAAQATATEVEVLRAMVAADRGRLDDPAALARSNRVFHRQLHRAARNRFLDGMLDHMRRSLMLLGGTTLGQPERGAAAVAEHAAIVEAVAARDPAAAEAAGRLHIRNAFRARIELGADAA